MAAKKKAGKASAGGKKAAAKSAKKDSPPPVTRKTRGASSTPVVDPPKTGSKRKASPSPAPSKRVASTTKKARTASPSPAPSTRQSRSRAASKTESKPTRSQSAVKEKPARAESKPRVTRAVVEEVSKKAEQPRGRSVSRRANVTSPRNNTPSTPKQNTTTPKQKVVTPKQKNEVPKQKSTPKRSSTPKQKVETPKQKATPKQTAATPKQKAASVTPKQRADTSNQQRKRSVTPRTKPEPQKVKETPKTVSPKTKKTPVTKQKTPKASPKPSAVAKPSPKKSTAKKVSPKPPSRASSRSRKSDDKVETNKDKEAEDIDTPNEMDTKDGKQEDKEDNESNVKSGINESEQKETENEKAEAESMEDKSVEKGEAQSDEECEAEEMAEKSVEAVVSEKSQSHVEAEVTEEDEMESEKDSMDDSSEDNVQSNKEGGSDIVPEEQQVSQESDALKESHPDDEVVETSITDESQKEAEEVMETEISEDPVTSAATGAADIQSFKESEKDQIVDEEPEAEPTCSEAQDKTVENQVIGTSEISVISADVETEQGTMHPNVSEEKNESNEVIAVPEEGREKAIETSVVIQMEPEEGTNEEKSEASDEKMIVEDDMAEDEDENVEEDQDVKDKEVEETSNAEAESTKVDTEQMDVIPVNEEVQDEPENNSDMKDDEDVIENQAESEQVEDVSQNELESAESDQIEADVEKPIGSQNEDSVEAVKVVDAVEVISDSSEAEAKEVIDINEDSGEAIIVEEGDDAQHENGSGDLKDTGNKTVSEQNIQEISDDDEDDVEEIGLSGAVIDTEEDVQVVEDQNITGIIEAEEATEAMNQGEVLPNGATNDETSPRKRKFDEVETEESDENSHKRLRASLDGQTLENGCVSQDVDLAKDYVVVDMGDVPPSDSQEVQDSIPKENVQNSLSQLQDSNNPVFNRFSIPNRSYANVEDTGNQFSIVSYNILADCHLLRNDYSFTSKEYLNPDYRLTNLIQELKYLNADVICLQEVDPQFFSDSLLPTLKSLGYDGFHKKRTAEDVDEGEATFYRVGRFTLVDASLVRIADLVEKELVESMDPGVRDPVRKYMDLCDVLIVTKLRCNYTNKEVTIGNIHVVWGEMKIPDAQCVQVASAIKDIVSKAGSENHAHIICGDFNSPPMSPGYLVARDGYPSDDTAITRLQQITGLQLPDGQAGSLVNSIWPAFQHTSSSLKSAYYVAQGSEPSITSYNGVMCDCVDYIFYSSNSLDTVSVLQTASKEKIMETGGTPNQFFPSDHVSMKAVLAFK